MSRQLESSNVAVSVPPNMNRLALVRRYVGFMTVGYGAIVMALYVMQNPMIFPGGGPINRTPATIGWDFESIVVNVNGYATHGWFIPAEEDRGTVLFSHGNGENIDHCLGTAAVFRELGLNTVLYDYGGYGDSEGSATESRCYDDIRAVWQWLTEVKGESPDRIVLFGRSLGGGPSVQLATEVDCAGLVLESTFASLPRVAQAQFPWLPARWLVRHRFDNASKITQIDVPILILHSRDDSLIPFEHGRELYQLAREPKEFVTMHGDHNSASALSRDIYMNAIVQFFNQIFPPQHPHG